MSERQIANVKRECEFCKATPCTCQYFLAALANAEQPREQMTTGRLSFNKWFILGVIIASLLVGSYVTALVFLW